MICFGLAQSTSLHALDASRDVLDKSLSHSEMWLAVFTLIVVFGLVVEHWKDIKEKYDDWGKWPFPWKRPPSPFKLKSLARVVGLGGLLVTLGVIGELFAESYLSHFDTLVRQRNAQIEVFLNTEAGNAKDSADKAAQDALQAQASAKQAAQEAGGAKTLAIGSRKEADSFERDIVSAKMEAAAAESDLADARQRAADALQQAANATAELNRLKANRVLTNVPAILSTLKGFRGTEYSLNGISLDDDSEHLLQVIDAVLQEAGWKRVAGSCHLPVFFVHFKNAPKYCVTEALTDGVQISIQYPGGASAVRSLPQQRAPQYVKAASSLFLLLRSDLSPKQETPDGIVVSSGTAKTVFISIGRKN